MKKTQELADLQTIIKSMPDYLNTEVIPTKICIIDALLNGGIEMGFFTQIVGEAGTGKSTISLYIAKKLCEQGKNVVYLDTENSISKEIIKSIGLDEYMKNECYRFFLYKLSTFTEVEEKLDQIILTGNIALVIVDSLAGLLNECYTNLQKKKSITETTSSYNSRPLGMFINKYKTLSRQKKFSLLFTNQYRNKIDIKGKTGTQLKEYGGKNVLYNTDTLIKIDLCKYREEKEFKNISEVYNEIGLKGVAITLEIIKSNKRASAKFPAHIIYAKGILDNGNYIYALRCLDIIKQAGSYYSISIQESEIKENGVANFIRKILELKINLYDLYKNEINEFYQR